MSKVRIRLGARWTETSGIKGKRWSATKARNHEGWTITHNRSGYAAGAKVLGELTRSEAYVIATMMDESGYDVRLNPDKHPIVTMDDWYIIESLAGLALEISLMETK